ncbi:MAG: hypothetical protein IKV03_02440 [Alphaproteobacteria bacterium]|nr:hypothetical protein [Alphaproteobacteria bacterium]
MNKYLFFLLTNCAVAAFSVAANAAGNVVENVVNDANEIVDAGVSSYEEWEATIGKYFTEQQRQDMLNGTMSQKDILDTISNSLSGESREAFLKEISQVSQLGNALDFSSSEISPEAAKAYLSGLEQDALDTVKNITGAFDGSTSFSSVIGSQLTGAVELMNNPQSLLSMGMGAISWDQITNLSLGAASDVVTDFLSAPTVGIPVMEGAFTASNAADKAAKAETGEVNNKVTDEKAKQVDAVGARPSTPASDAVVEAAQNDATGDSNPALDSCPALMASYPRQSNKAYDFLQINYLDKLATDKYAPQADMASAVLYVENQFFAKNDQLTSEKQDELQKKRDAYMADMVANVLTLNIGIQQNLVEDAMSIPLAPTSGCNLIDDLNVSTMIMISMAKQTMADIASQIQLLEFDGVQRIKHTPIELLAKPEEKKK